VACYSGAIVRVDPKGRVLDKIHLHEGAVKALRIHPHQPLGARCSADGALISWTLDGRLHDRYLGHMAIVDDVAIDPSGTYLASVSRDFTFFYALDHRDGSLDLGTIEARDRAPAAFLERLWRARLGQRSTGFKFTHGQDERALEIVLHDRGIRKIVLRRINQLKTYVSAKIAEKTGQWEVYREADLVANKPKIAVDFEEFRRHAAENDRFYAGDRALVTPPRGGPCPLCQRADAGTRRRRGLRNRGERPGGRASAGRGWPERPRGVLCLDPTVIPATGGLEPPALR
jgi:hypothetical protein